MKFKNYLLKIEKGASQKSKENICICGVSEVIKEIYLELKKSCNRGIIKEKLKSPYPTLYSWTSGSNPIPISKAYELLKFWKNKCNKTEQEFNKKWNLLYEKIRGFSQNGQKTIKLPKEFNECLAYVMGFFQGDGHLKKENTNGFQEYSTYFYEANEEVLDNLNKKIESLFGIKGNIYFQSNITGKWFTLRLCSKPVYLFFNKVVGLTSGRKVRNVKVPEIIKNKEMSLQLSFIRGFFDAEGGIGETSKNPWLDIGQASKDAPCEILVWIQKVLKEQGILLSEPKRTKNQEFFRIRTAKRETIKRFFEVISSNHIEKISKFNCVINK